MEKIAVGPAAKGQIDLRAPIAWNIEQVAEAKGIQVEEVTVIILDRDRNTEIADQVRAAGARIKFITDGDAPAAVSAAIEGSGVDMMLGIGGSPGRRGRRLRAEVPGSATSRPASGPATTKTAGQRRNAAST